MIIERISHSGAYSVYTVIGDSLVRRYYGDFTYCEAAEDFAAEFGCDLPADYEARKEAEIAALLDEAEA